MVISGILLSWISQEKLRKMDQPSLILTFVPGCWTQGPGGGSLPTPTTPPPFPAQAVGSYLFLNFCGSLLGGLKVLHQGRFSQEVPGGRGEAREQVVFQCFEGDFEPILLLREL